MRPVLTKLAGYICTGGAAAVVDLGGFAGLLGLGWSVPVAATASFGVAMLFNYAASSRFVFRQPLGWRRLLVFAATSLVGLAVNVGVTSAAMLLFLLPPLLAKTAGIGIAFAVNFTMNLLVTFRHSASGRG
jgi:putative flippase GtrA